MQKSLNEIYDYIKYFSDNHAQVHSCSFGELNEITNINSTEAVYPLIHSQVDSAKVEDKFVYLTMNILCMDLTNKDEDNTKDVLSDCLLILNDLYLWFSLTKDFHSNGIKITNSNLTPFTERFRDEVSGWNLQIEFKINNTGVCNIPLGLTPYTQTVRRDYLELVYDSEFSIPYYSIGDWQTYFNIAFTDMSITGTNVKLFGTTANGTSTVTPSKFYQNPSLIEFYDYPGFFTAIEEGAFWECFNLTTVYAPAVTSVKNLGFYDAQNLQTVMLSSCTQIQHTNCFSTCFSLTNIDLRACTQLGATTGDDFTFYGIMGNTIDFKLKNGTQTDGDVVYLQNNNTVNLTLY